MTVDRTQTQYHDASNTHLRKTGIATGPASYATGGDPAAPALFGMARMDLLLFEPFSNGTNIALARYNYATGAVQFFDPSTKAEIANATNLSAYTARFEAIGK